MMLSETDKKFAEAVHIFQNLPQELRPTQEEELEFYGLYKRAVVGQCDIPKPDFFNILALAKWEAWKKLDSLSMLKAREVYVEQLIKLLERFPDRPDVVELLDTFTKLHLNDNDDGVSAKSVGKTNTIRSNTSDSINNELSMGNGENPPPEYSVREVQPTQNSSINSNVNGSGLSRNNSSLSATDDYLNLNNHSGTRARSKTDGSIYASGDISMAHLQPQTQEEPSFRSENTFMNNSSSLNPKITSPLQPSMSPLNPGMGGMNGMNGMGNMGLGTMGMGGMAMNMNNPNAKIAASTSMSIVMLTRLRDLEIEVSSLNTRLNLLTNTIKNQNKNTLQNWLKFALKTFGANLLIFLIMVLVLGPSGYEKVIGQLPAWLLRLQSRYILGSKGSTTRAIEN